MKRLAIVATALSLLFPTSARALHLDPDDRVVLDEQPVSQKGWVAYKIRTGTDSDVTIEITGTPDDARMFTFGIFTPDGWSMSGYQWNNGHRVAVRTQPTGTIADDGDPRVESHDYGWRPSLTFIGLDDEEFTFVAYAAADGVFDGRFRILGENAELVGKTSGTTVWLVHGDGFNGLAHADVSERWLGDGWGVPGSARATTTAGGTATIDVRNAFFGWFRPGSGHATFDGPLQGEGSELFNDAPAGRYRFDLHATASDGPPALAGADVRLP